MIKNFKFYADESGHADDPALYYAGMAGFVAPAGAWEVFEGEWNNLLRFAGVSELHMKYFVHCEGEFAKWKGKEHETERRAFLRRALEIIKGTHATPVGAAVSLRDFESLTEFQRNSFLNPYYVAFQTCTRGAAIEAAFEEPDEKVAMVYGYNKEFGAVEPQEVYSVDQAGRAEQLWYAIQESSEFGSRMKSYRSGTPHDSAPLQAADLFAYELCHEFENQVRRPDRGMRYPLRQILQMVGIPLPRIVLFDRKELLRRVKESKFGDQTGVEEVPPDQMQSAMWGMTRWMLERAGITFPLAPLGL